MRKQSKKNPKKDISFDVTIIILLIITIATILIYQIYFEYSTNKIIEKGYDCIDLKNMGVDYEDSFCDCMEERTIMIEKIWRNLNPSFPNKELAEETRLIYEEVCGS